MTFILLMPRLLPSIHLSIADLAVDMSLAADWSGIQRDGRFAMLMDVACFSVGVLVDAGVLWIN